MKLVRTLILVTAFAFAAGPADAKSNLGPLMGLKGFCNLEPPERWEECKGGARAIENELQLVIDEHAYLLSSVMLGRNDATTAESAEMITRHTQNARNRLREFETKFPAAWAELVQWR